MVLVFWINLIAFSKIGKMRFEGPLQKLSTQFGSTVTYRVKLGDDLLFLNSMIGKQISLTFKGEHTCFCGNLVPEVYRQNFCRECFFTKPEASPTIMKPELSKAHLGIEERDLEFERRLQLQPHYVYLAKTDRIKVGVTRSTQMPYRWMDQGAKSAVILLETPNRYLAGEAEVALKDYFTDKTSWQAMLKDLGTDDRLEEARSKALEVLPNHLSEFAFEEARIWEFNYPIAHQIEKVKSVSFKQLGDSFAGELYGIRGQYLMTSVGVFNVRSHAGFMVEMEVG